MISHQKSLRPLSLILTLLVLTSCSLKTRKEVDAKNEAKSEATGHFNDAQKTEKTNYSIYSGSTEYSIQADRSELSELRKQIPVEKKRKNDELALVLELMQELKLHPSKVRSRFDKVLRKKRNKFNKDLRKERDAFNKDERKKRDQFLDDLKRKRKRFRALKTTRDQQKSFNEEYREQREDFFNEAREKRLEQESEWRQERRDFEAYIREKRSEFNDEMRSYNKRYYEYHKAKKLQKRMKSKEARIKRRQVYQPGDMFSSQPSRSQRDQSRGSSSFDQIYSKPAHLLQPPSDEQ